MIFDAGVTGKLSDIDNNDDDANFVKNELCSIKFLVVTFVSKFDDGLEKVALTIVTWSIHAIVNNIIITDKSILISVIVSHFLTSFFLTEISCFLRGIS